MTAAVTSSTDMARARVRAPRSLIRGTIGVLVLVMIAELAPRTGLVDETYLPPFSRMVAALIQEMGRGVFWQELGATLSGWALGLTIATVFGIALGLTIGSIPILRELTASTIEFLRPIPSVALIPLAILLFGTDMRSTLLLVLYSAFWPVLLQVLYGVRDVDPVARDTARSYRFSTFTQVRMLTWPTALPYIMTGFRLAASVALILELTGELIIRSPGIGRQIALAQGAGAYDTMYALVIVAGLIGVAVNGFARVIERRALRWHTSIRRDVTR